MSPVMCVLKGNSAVLVASGMYKQDYSYLVTIGFLSNVLPGPLNSLLASLSCASEKILIALIALDSF